MTRGARARGTSIRRWGSLLALVALVTAGLAARWVDDGPEASTPQVTTAPSSTGHTRRTDDALPAFLPAEARVTLQRIASSGPFPHPQDGGVFGNREGRLPRQPRGFYREYTVDTPGLGHRGARRIVTGGQPPRRYYYTEDHYDSFRSFEVRP